jgi:hypothetical protein
MSEDVDSNDLLRALSLKLAVDFSQFFLSDYQILLSNVAGVLTHTSRLVELGMHRV